jgi:hypothetical protein
MTTLPGHAPPPSSFNMPWVRATIDRWWLAFWFALVSVIGLILPQFQQSSILVDARLYVDAARTWLAGGDPWSVNIGGLYFAAPPPTLLAVAPFTLLPEPWGSGALGVVCLAGAVATVRLLRLPVWWLLFPPLVQAVIAGNVQTLLVPLLLGMGGALAPILKIYAAVPLAILGRWRALLASALLVLLTAPLLPWTTYLDQFAAIYANLVAQSTMGPSVIAALVLAPVAAVCLWIVGRERAAWLVVPAIWPAQQWYYATLVLPTRSRLVAGIIATPIPIAGFVALVAAAVHAWRSRRSRPSGEAG